MHLILICKNVKEVFLLVFTFKDQHIQNINYFKFNLLTIAQ